MNLMQKIGRVKDTIRNWRALRDAKQLKSMTKGESGIRITTEEVIDRFGSEIDWKKGYEKFRPSRRSKDLTDELDDILASAPI